MSGIRLSERTHPTLPMKRTHLECVEFEYIQDAPKIDVNFMYNIQQRMPSLGTHWIDLQPYYHKPQQLTQVGWFSLHPNWTLL